MPFQRSLLCVLVCSVLFGAGSAGATQTFIIDSANSFLGIVNAEFNKIPPTFQTTLEPLAPDDWVRSLSGTFTADETTGALETADFEILGAPLAGDQIILDSRGRPRDLGDIVLAALAVSVGLTGQATFTAGTIDFDLSLGNTRISSSTPFSMLGVTSTTINMGTPSVNGMQVTIPIMLQFEDVQVYLNGNASFDLVGTIQGTLVPEPSTGLSLALGLVALAAGRHASRQRRS